VLALPTLDHEARLLVRALVSIAAERGPQSWTYAELLEGAERAAP